MQCYKVEAMRRNTMFNILMHEMVGHSHSAESFAGRWSVGRRRLKTHMLMSYDKDGALACE